MTHGTQIYTRAKKKKHLQSSDPIAGAILGFGKAQSYFAASKTQVVTKTTHHCVEPIARLAVKKCVALPTTVRMQISANS